MDTENGENMELYTGWVAVWVLLGCYVREFWKDENITAEKVEQLRQRTAEITTHIEHCKEAGLLRLKDIDKGGGYSAILRGLAEIEEQAATVGGGMTAEEWQELEFIAIKIRIHAWAQKMGVYCKMREERRAETVP